MANASIDENSTRSILGALNTNGTTVVKVLANATTHALAISDGTTGTDHGSNHALTDDNGTKSWVAASSADGKTPIVVYADSSGNLLVNSN